MKKFVLLIMLVGSMLSTFAQDGIDIYITDYPASMELCVLDGQKVYVIPEDSCGFFVFFLNGTMYPNANPLVIDPAYGYNFEVSYDGCNVSHQFNVTYGRQVPNAYTKDVWIPEEQETVILTAVGTDSIYYYQHAWSNGSNNWYIEAGEGTYSCELSNACGSATRTFMVRKNVEIYRATVDLATNLNKVTWQTNESQAEYISQVKVYRDGFFVGTAPYENGYFLDAIGSDNAARNYHLVAVTTDGVESPASYQKGTIHTTYYLDVNDNLNMTWNIPYVEQGAQGSLTYFQVCKYDPVTEQLTVVDQVNSLITDYTCGMNQFAGGYPVIAAVFSNGRDREFEDMSFSNMYTDMAIQPQEITITLTTGWTWISYPYAVAKNIATALGDFVPMEGDVIKSQFGYSSYHNGKWRGSFQQLIPGMGYHYFSTRTEPTTLVFDLSSSRR